MEQSNCPLQTIIPLDKYFTKVNCRRIVKGFIVLMGSSKNRQIKKQAKKFIPVKADLHHVHLAQWPEGGEGWGWVELGGHESHSDKG